MAFFEALFSFFSPPASRASSPQPQQQRNSTSFFSVFSPTHYQQRQAQQSDLPLPPTSAHEVSATMSTSQVELNASAVSLTEARDAQPTGLAPHRSDSVSSSATSITTVSNNQAQQPSTVQNTTNNNTITATNTLPVTNYRPDPPRRSATDIAGPRDPLSRQFPVPAQEPSLDELLARSPPKYSLGRWVKNARTAKPRDDSTAEEAAARRARELEAAKAELRRAKEEMERLRA